MTEEELTAAYESGTLSAEDQERFLNGEDLSGETDDASPASDTDEEADKEVIVEQVQEPEKAPVVLARDGVHTLPFSVVEELRESNATLKQAFEEQKGLIEQLSKAKEVDEEEGNTDATDDVLAVVEEEFPGFMASLQKLLIDPLKADLEPIKASNALKVQQDALKVQQDEASQARVIFDDSVTALEPTYKATTATQEFWDWFGTQSPLIKAAQTSSDPAVVADVIKLYNSQKTPATDKAGDVANKVKEAMEKASTRSTVQTLSDVPGGVSPAADQVEAFTRLSPSAQTAHMMSLSAVDREKLLDRLV